MHPIESLNFPTFSEVGKTLTLPFSSQHWRLGTLGDHRERRPVSLEDPGSEKHVELREYLSCWKQQPNEALSKTSQQMWRAGRGKELWFPSADFHCGNQSGGSATHTVNLRVTGPYYFGAHAPLTHECQLIVEVSAYQIPEPAWGSH